MTHGHPNGLPGVFPVVVDNLSKKQYSNESVSVNDIAVQNTSSPVSHMDDKESSNVSSHVNDLPAENTSSHVSHTDDKESSNVSPNVSDITVQNKSSPVSPMDDKESSNVFVSVNDLAAENTSSHVSPKDDKESSTVSSSHMDDQESSDVSTNTSSHVSPMVDKELPESFPQSHGASDKNEHIHNKYSTVEDEHIHNTQFALHPDENVSKTNSSILDEECILCQFPDTKGDEDSEEELEIIVQDSENEEIQLLVDQRDVDYSFLASLCESYAFCGYQGVGIVAN